ncbi:hypothetical protein K438DRAFT_1777924 [Mycena galopus ATCC 62051]|nr:hypothetical protein K438DRAFT_1777924 [Mycena galopus ATCC 62051]
MSMEIVLTNIIVPCISRRERWRTLEQTLFADTVGCLWREGVWREAQDRQKRLRAYGGRRKIDEKGEMKMTQVMRRTSPREKVSRKRVRAISDDDGDNDDSTKDHKRQKSDSSTRSSTARRNAEAGGARSVETLSAAMNKPIVTSEDLSHVDKVIEILQDKTLLSPDHRGHFFGSILVFVGEII